MERYYTNPGSPIKIEMIPKINKDGMIELVEGEKTDLQAYIESFRDETNIENIIARFVNGDESALSKAQGFYGDMKDLPRSYSEVLNLVYEGQKVFESMPVDVKEKFGSDFNIWFSTMGQDSWYEKMSYGQDPVEPVVKESTSDES